MSSAKVVCQSTMLELPPEAGGGQLLVVDITIDCPVCGTYLLQVAGHHLKAIRDFLVETIDQYPELTGKDGDYAAVEKLQIRGPGNDPSRS